MDFSKIGAFFEETFKEILDQQGTNIALKAATNLRKNMIERIFHRGLSAEETPISNAYSTKPMYASREQVGGRFKPTGKRDVVEKTYTTGKSGVSKQKNKITQKGNINKKNRKTIYLSEGYKELRQLKGRQTSFVDFRLTGSLLASIQPYKITDKAVLAIANRDEVTKSNALEKRYNKKIFEPSEKETELVNKDIFNEIGDNLQKILS